MASNGNSQEVCSDVNDKRQIIGHRLQKRNDDRQAEVQKRHEEKNLTDAAQENVKCFEDAFGKEKEEIEEQLANLEDIDKRQYLEQFDMLSVKLSKLQKYVSESTLFLSSYEVNRAQQTMSRLKIAIQEKRDERIPKKKFAFKSKKQERHKEEVTAVKVNVEDKQQNVPHLEVELAECKFVNIQDSKLEKFATDLNQKDVALAHLNGCTVKLFGTPSAIHINKLINCMIFSGPVSGSVFIRECENCTFILPCQQLRIHTTKKCDFYIHVTSKAIIEDCINTRFAPFAWSYPDIDEHYIISTLNRSRNNWDNIDDFNWLVSGKQSPNWSILPEKERRSEFE